MNYAVAALNVRLDHFGIVDLDVAIAGDRETLPLHGLCCMQPYYIRGHDFAGLAGERPAQLLEICADGSHAISPVIRYGHDLGGDELRLPDHDRAVDGDGVTISIRTSIAGAEKPF